jgi:hypothetical protein
MQRSIFVFAVLLFCGCGRHGDSKPAQASPTPTAATTIVAAASNTLIKTEAKPPEALSDEGEIRVAACEYMLRNKFMNLTNGIIFVSLTNAEMQTLAARLPVCRFRSIDKMTAGDDDNLRDSDTRDMGYGLLVDGVQVHTNEATVGVAARFIGSATFFTCHMYKRPSEWIVLFISGPGIADGPWGPPLRQ